MDARGMKIVYFTHSLRSCWNHGNAHFQRGLLRELLSAGHEVTIFEPEAGWSIENLMREHGAAGLEPFQRAYPELHSRSFSPNLDLSAALRGAHLVIIHEWNDLWLIAAIGRMRKRGAPFVLLFHDTHHRAVSDPGAVQNFDLSGFDGVLAFGAALADLYRCWGFCGHALVFHEAADTRHFHPPDVEQQRAGLVWIGNWGDDERSAELEQFMLRPAAKLGLPLDIYGVRYTDAAVKLLDSYGARYCGWAANASVPEIYDRYLATIHVPRRHYSSVLPGIPTIRVFEALACGIPLVSAPWEDTDGLFTPGSDYLVARSEGEMVHCLAAVRDDANLRSCLAKRGLATICARHTCAHRAQELLTIAARLSRGRVETAA
jgi:spore maturation protein CgeB